MKGATNTRLCLRSEWGIGTLWSCERRTEEGQHLLLWRSRAVVLDIIRRVKKSQGSSTQIGLEMGLAKRHIFSYHCMLLPLPPLLTCHSHMSCAVNHSRLLSDAAMDLSYLLSSTELCVHSKSISNSKGFVFRAELSGAFGPLLPVPRPW